MTTQAQRQRVRVLLGKWSRQDLGDMLAAAEKISPAGRRVAFLSAQFLGIPYRESTLTGGVSTPEVFTVNLEAVDCFTYLDYVEAMRQSDSFKSFKQRLRVIRYRGGNAGYETRNHFFTDWTQRNSRVCDVTADIGRQHVRHVRKRLNDRGDGTYFLPGISPEERDIAYIPRKEIDIEIIRRLRTGDYIGIYAKTRGLDVSHVGILIKRRRTVCFRHACSLPSQRKVIDQDFRAYITGKPGIIVLRPQAGEH